MTQVALDTAMSGWDQPLSRRIANPPPIPNQCARTRITLLGRFAITALGRRVSLPPSAQRLVALLALNSHTLGRVQAAGILWPETTQDRANASLRSALWRLRQAGISIVAASATSLGLVGGVGIDVRDVEARARRLIDRSVICESWELNAACFDAELLPDWYEDDWVSLERERLRQLCLHALEALSMRFSQLGRHGEAVDTALAAVRCEPLRESAQRTLILAHLAEENRVEARHQFERYTILLNTELGVTPSLGLAALLDYKK